MEEMIFSLGFFHADFRRFKRRFSRMKSAEKDYRCGSLVIGF
jgi:hypothetical protein